MNAKPRPVRKYAEHRYHGDEVSKLIGPAITSACARSGIESGPQTATKGRSASACADDGAPFAVSCRRCARLERRSSSRPAAAAADSAGLHRRVARHEVAPPLGDRGFQSRSLSERPPPTPPHRGKPPRSSLLRRSRCNTGKERRLASLLLLCVLPLIGLFAKGRGPIPPNVNLPGRGLYKPHGAATLTLDKELKRCLVAAARRYSRPIFLPEVRTRRRL